MGTTAPGEARMGACLLSCNPARLQLRSHCQQSCWHQPVPACEPSAAARILTSAGLRHPGRLRCRVAHPALIPIAKEVFDEHMKTPNQIDRQRDDVVADEEALLQVGPSARPPSCLSRQLVAGNLHQDLRLQTAAA